MAGGAATHLHFPHATSLPWITLPSLQAQPQSSPRRSHGMLPGLGVPPLPRRVWGGSTPRSHRGSVHQVLTKTLTRRDHP